MSTEAPPMPAAKPNPVSRMGGVIAAPDPTFRDIADRPDWLLPLLLLLVAGALMGFSMVGHVDLQGANRDAMERMGVSGADAEKQLEQAEQVQKVTVPIFSAVGACVEVLIVAAVLLLAMKVFGGEGTFKQSLGVTAYAWTPSIIKMVIVAILLFRSEMVDVRALPGILKSNLGFLSDPESAPAAYAFLSSIDAFSIWTVVLLGIGMAHAHRLSKAATTVIVATLYALVVVGKVGIALIMGGAD